MDYSNIDRKIDRLNLKWREYDFGDTLYIEAPATLMIKNIGIDSNCKTHKYDIKFQKNNRVLIFKEIEQVSFVHKLVATILKINSTISKQETKVSQPKSESTENTNYQTY